MYVIDSHAKAREKEDDATRDGALYRHSADEWQVDGTVSLQVKLLPFHTCIESSWVLDRRKYCYCTRSQDAPLLWQTKSSYTSVKKVTLNPYFTLQVIF